MIDKDTQPVSAGAGKPDTASPRKRFRVSQESIAAFLQTYCKIQLSWDGHQFRAEAPELNTCAASKKSYAEALQRIERTLSGMIAEAMQSHARMPDEVLKALRRFPLLSELPMSRTHRSLPIKSRLIEKFGPRSNRELAACIGIVSADAPIMLSSAMAGNGTRKIRCAIALALDEPPSSLWPGQADGRTQADDRMFYLLRRHQMNNSVMAATQCESDPARAGAGLSRDTLPLQPQNGPPRRTPAILSQQTTND